MELILVVAAAFVVGVSALAMHISVSNQSSKSSVSEALDDIEKSKEELDKKIKTQLLLGTVTIIAKIANWQAGREKAQKEKINEIASASGAAATAIGMNIAQDAIQAIGDSISDIVAIPDSESSILPFIPPAIPGEGLIPNPLIPADIAPQGVPLLTPPKLDPSGIPPLIPPVEKTKELGGNILWAKKTGTGEYSQVGGHHVHAKAAFKDDVNDSPDKGFSISQDYMESNGWDHAKMTKKQRELFKELYGSGRPNTLEEHTRIAEEALIAGGANDIAANQTTADTLGDAHIETFPKAEQERSTIHDTPRTEQKEPEPLVFPKTEQEPKIFSFPHENKKNRS